MERHVKERLVGAAVLIAAAVILIPELLSGPKHAATPPAPARAGEVPMKTYTIDLNRSPDAPASTTLEAAPRPEVADSAQSGSVDAATQERPGQTAAEETFSAQPDPVESPEALARSAPEPAPEAIPDSSQVQSSRSVGAPASVPQSVSRSASPEPSQPAASAPTARPLASAATAPRSRQWAVQLGSFASKANAERLVKEWEGRGQRGTVSPVKAASGTLYRVRLGPFAERDAAEDTLRKVRSSVTGAAVVAYP